MRKKLWIASILTVSLTLLSTGIQNVQKSQAGSSDIHTFQRVTTGINHGLLRYQYIDEDGKELQLPSTDHGSARKRAATLPSSYNSYDQGVVTPMRDQGITGGCWAFATLKALESSSIKKKISVLENTDYSENHLLWYTYDKLKDTSHPLYGDYMDMEGYSDTDIYDFGGNALMAAFTLANGWGAVSEDKAPFSANTRQDLKKMATEMMEADEALRFQSDIRLTEANCYDDASINEIKQAVIDYGSLDVALYYNSINEYTKNGVSSYYQNKKDSSEANHCVTIVGWDDSFHTFSNSSAPIESGAWLIANSYGPEYGMDGYFWLSYYDTSLCEFYSYEGEPADTYDTSFQYDGFGWNSGYFDTEDIALANVFTNTQDSPRQIEAVSFYTLVDYQKYQIRVYRHVKDGGPTDGEPLSRCTVSGTAQRGGYHTVSLENTFSIAPGERFSVVVTFQPDEATNHLTYALVEGEDDTHNSVYYHSTPGQSYVYFASSNTWYDNTAAKDTETGKFQNNNNVCIKALGNSITDQQFQEWEKNYIPETSAPVDGTVPGLSSPSFQLPIPSADTQNPTPSVTPSNQPSTTADTTPQGSSLADTEIKITGVASKLVIGKGETVSIPVTVHPASSKKQLQFTSSNKKIATVKNSGKVTGRKTGKTTITIFASGKPLKKISVIVKKQPSTVRLRAGKTTIKKGKTAKLKTTLSRNSASYQLTYHSKKPKIASVSKNGIVKGKKKGSVWIVVRTYNKKTARVRIRVTD